MCSSDLITDLIIKNNDLIVATQGRAFWVIDDLSMVQQKDMALPEKDLKVFTVNDTYRTDGSGGERRSRRKLVVHNAGDNPPSGVVFNYYLRSQADSALSITIFDKQGKQIKTFSKTEKDAADKIDYTPGMNQFVWDMLYPPGETVEGLILWNGGVGPAKAAPGNYKARFRLSKDSVDVPFVIKANPGYERTEADYDEQVGFLLQLRDKFSEVQKGIKNIRQVRAQLSDFTSRMDSSKNKDIKTMADSIQKKITRIEEALYQTKSKSGQDVLNFPIRLNDKLAGLYGVGSSGENAPSKQLKESFADLSAQSDVQLAKLKTVMDTDIPALNKRILEAQLPVIGIKPE